MFITIRWLYVGSSNRKLVDPHFLTMKGALGGPDSVVCAPPLLIVHFRTGTVGEFPETVKSGILREFPQGLQDELG